MECPACHQQNIDGARFCAKCGALLPVQTEETDPLINTVVGGRYRITGVLGEGGMGRVYVGEQQMGTSVRKVAIKTLLSQYAKEPETVARFMREVGTVSELEHPNTIRVYDFGQTPSGELYIAMELLTGKSLEEALEQGGAMAPERVDRIVGQTCGSLEEAHGKGIVHRDLKPANIFLTTRAGEEDYVKVLDFGIAKKSESAPGGKEHKLTQQGKILGTPPYMSPEQFMGKDLDARSDVYSLGVMTYEMLTGRLPFEADTPWGWATQHMTAQPFPFEAQPIGAAVPDKMRRAVMRALEKDKENRPQTVREFFEELTLGAARLSMLAQRTPSLLGVERGSSASASTAVLGAGAGGGPATGSASARAGGTQVGEPIFVPGAAGSAPQAHTMMDQAPLGIAAVPGAGAPTGGGQVFAPPPPQSRPKKSSPLPMILGAGAAVAALVVGVVLFASRGKGGDEEPEPIAIGAGEGTAETAAVAADPPPTAEPVEDAGATEVAAADAGGTPSSANTGSGRTGTSIQTPVKPAVDPAAAAACASAARLAAGNNISLAVAQYRKCDGPAKGAAKSAIDAASLRIAQSKGCRGKAEVSAAAAIGASSGKKALPKECR